MGLMNQSTIYRRHEARLARSYALRDDPRPAFIRVLSGLPGFRMVIPPYKEERKDETETPNQQKQGHENVVERKTPIGAYSEETLFTPYSDIADNVVSSASDPTRGIVENIFRDTIVEHVMQAILATGFCSGIAEYVLTHQNTVGTAKRAVWNSNLNRPVAMTSPHAVYQSSLFFRQEQLTASHAGDFGTHEGSARGIPNAANKTLPSVAAKTRPATVALSKALTASISTSLLFGTKVFLDSAITAKQLKKDEDHYNYHPVIRSLLSSAAAGGMVGLTQLVILQFQCRQPRSQRSSLAVAKEQYLTGDYSLKLIGRNVIAALLYFSIYEGVSSFSMKKARLSSRSMNCWSNDNVGGEKGTLSIIAGGAFAGIGHVGAMNYHRYAHFGSTIWWSRIMLPGVSRAVPIHALVFYGYEKMKEGVKTSEE
mmetsp:Transcript_24163/g.66945  ORF Transcript_24163/g.66945 Transcript_24163/m.66945 type:complete len:426 (-) Transcript_24163:644-1921(-)|eukprot:CAMPEP_0172375522 /NCGR_PEP_ID=MMETSP1060-20121228/62194_1 /TAXON_ID=37318 /ORGANISM="Pseudo-nitzschia pungens, Strain cf. cingulata" /LENGTH=425 /DNA_ID=CAMNT_0013102687 /DNA_START=95 /DNA_END=1372 /DNA_ORIENTATION=+